MSQISSKSSVNDSNKMRQFRFITLLCLLSVTVVHAQTAFDLYGHTVTPPNNISSLQKGVKKTYDALGKPLEGKYILIAQFKTEPSISDRLNLKQFGVTVYDNIGERAYFVAVKSDKIRVCTKKTNMVSLFAQKAEWRVSPLLQSDSIPAYALKEGKIGVIVFYQEAISEKTINARLKALRFKELPHLEGKPNYSFDCWVERKTIDLLKKEAWVKRIRLVYPPATPVEEGV